MLKQGVYDALKMAVALELAGRAFEAFPGAMRTARVAVLALLAASTVVLGALTPRSSYMTLWEWQPGVATAALWLLTATALLVVLYQVPVHDWQRAIMLGLALVPARLRDPHRPAAAPRVGGAGADRDARRGGLPRAGRLLGLGRVATGAGHAGGGAPVTVELVLSSLGCALLCYSLGRYNRTLTLRRWEFVLNAPERRAVESLRQRMALDSALARQALDAASRAREASRAPDALTVLRVALSVLEEAGADRRTRLRAMGVYARMVRAIEPLPAPAAAPFKGPELRAAASVAGLAHRLLVGTQERFRLWLLFLGLGVGIVLRAGRRSAEAAAREPPQPEHVDAFAQGVDDFEALDACHLTAFEALVASLSAMDQGGRLRLWERIVGDAG